MTKGKIDPIQTLDIALDRVKRRTKLHVDARIAEGAVVASCVNGKIVEHKQKVRVAA